MASQFRSLPSRDVSADSAEGKTGGWIALGPDGGDGITGGAADFCAWGTKFFHP